MRSHVSGSRQGELFARPRRTLVALEANHRFVQVANRIDWTDLAELVQGVRRRKLKSRAGRPPRLRPLIGAVILMSLRRMTYREAEDQIRHYSPARYLCGLEDSTWTPDFTTIQDFTELLGEDGLRAINEHVVSASVERGLADPSVLVADTTAQEATIPYPNEVGLMTAFVSSVVLASRRMGRLFGSFRDAAKPLVERAKRRMREYRLFSKHKEKPVKDRMVAAIAAVVEKLNRRVGGALEGVRNARISLKNCQKRAHRKLTQLHATMSKLLPQIRHWLRTGLVAPNKIVSLVMPETYALVREKAGKKVEFGVRWGIARLRGGYLRARPAKNARELMDSRFAITAVDDHVATFGSPPKCFAYDRGGHSLENVEKLRKRGVRHIGLAPRGRCPWVVSDSMRRKLVRERACVEGGIAAIKSARYGFSKPAARSVAMMTACGQRAVLGFNINKMVRDLCARERLTLVGP